jgi:NIMA-interacting peptidyl-prolyl cis-trans isomerase 1
MKNVPHLKITIMSHKFRMAHIHIRTKTSHNPKSHRTGKNSTLTDEEAIEFLEGLDLTGDNFEDMAKKYSDCSTYIVGGDALYFYLEDIHPELAQELVKMEVGEVSGVVQTHKGFHRILRIA